MPIIESYIVETKVKTSSIGLIIPPPELKSTVDKTAQFVARNGKEFEDKILEREASNRKFEFLKPEHLYYKYYQKKVQEYVEGKQANEIPSKNVHQKQQEILKKILVKKFVPENPPKKYEFIIDPPSLSSEELDLVKLTAQFVSRNGKQFLTNLMNREQKNYEFDFLRPQHTLFPYFAKLIEQYTKILIPPANILQQLKDELNENRIKQLLNDVDYHAKWLKYEEDQKRLENEKAEKERLAYQNIDWHDFTVVECIEYHPNEIGDFPPPLTAETLGERLLKEIREIEDDIDVEMQIESDDDTNDVQNDQVAAEKIQESKNMKEEIDEILQDKNHFEQVTDVAMNDEEIIIKNYDPKAARKNPSATSSEAFLISPLTGEKIPASQFEEHMRINLLDPRWMEQRQKMMEKANEEPVYATGNTVISHLKQLAERRTDIFGDGDQETVIGKKIGEEEVKDNRIIWDGHSSSLESTTRAIQQNITSEIESHRTSEANPVEKPTVAMPSAPIFKMPLPVNPRPNIIPSEAHFGNIQYRPSFPVPRQMLMIRAVNPMYQMPMLSQPRIPPNIVDQPQSMECDDDQSFTGKRLIPEDEFLRLSNSPILIQIQVPNILDKSDWKLNGQLLSFSIELTDTILMLKQKIHERTDMPPTKQKLSHDKTFLKDVNTLAYYNLETGSRLNLQIKERGGRKK